ncbi:MAG: hypothetical protein HYR77_06340 [Ignavibacteria bacterium]|nr:hypothetical protein [Ignavibacteria bacterium]
MGLSLSFSTIFALLAMQLALFGWRINREIPVGDQGRKTWFPVSDIINILSMLSVVFFCVINPLAAKAAPISGSITAIPNSAKIVFTVAMILLAFHPIAMIGHYRLLSKRGRSIYLKPDGTGDYPYCTGAEVAIVVVSLLSAVAGGYYVAVA